MLDDTVTKMLEAQAGARRLTGSEPFHRSGANLSISVLDFWQWASSDLLGNALRGLLAEYLVAHALGCAEGVRVEWAACDLRTSAGVKVEVKTSGYVQSWNQRAESRPTFDISPKLSWDAASNTSADRPGRPADVYVFAVHAHRTREAIDPTDLGQWEFYVVRTSVLEAQCPNQKRIGLAGVRKLSGGAVGFEDLARKVHEASVSPSC